jgi:hypothetical protein
MNQYFAPGSQWRGESAPLERMMAPSTQNISGEILPRTKKVARQSFRP